MASGVSASGKRNYTSAFNSAGNHLVAGRPFAKTFTITDNAASTDDSILTFVSPAAGTALFDDATAVNGVAKYGQLIKISFPSTMSSVQVSVQETGAAGTPANMQARILFVPPGQEGASATKANPMTHGNYVQLGDSPTAPEGAVGFSTAMNQIYILISSESGGSPTAAAGESITFLVTGHMPLNEADTTPNFDLSTFTFGAATGLG